MYFDLNVPIPLPSGGLATQFTKGKAKQVQSPQFTPAQLTAIEARIDLLVHLGYSVLAFNQQIKTKVEPKTFINTLDPLLRHVKKRLGVIYLKRLTILLDEDSEKGFGLTNAQTDLFSPYDIIALAPTTEGSFSLACLTHTQPSPLSAHVISVPLDVPRLSFHMKHTMVRTALRNGAVFEIPYASALDSNAKRNWWAAAREVVRVTKGKGLIVTSGGLDVADLRAPKDIANLLTFLGLAQNVTHDSATTNPKSLVLRAQTRKTYRAVFSEPKLVLPGISGVGPVVASDRVETKPSGERLAESKSAAVASQVPLMAEPPTPLDGRQSKRARDSAGLTDCNTVGGARKKRKGKKSG
ncbi:PHP domain-like protein [Russula earlei]|uniref:PHP domain-like protein n=1 Tax=Russula earlei TaxID=71964 RepID=A0ACC0TZ02_9AGAM|nr:PHP domain-like protein [Russula earlei]